MLSTAPSRSELPDWKAEGKRDALMRKQRGSESLPWKGRWSRAKDGIHQQRAWRQELLSGALTDSADKCHGKEKFKK